MKFSKESWILGIICFADMLSTIWLLKTGRAVEANPIMRYYLSGGMIAFVAAKTFLWFGPVFVIEVVRQKRRGFGLLMLRTTVVLYIVVYSTLVWHVNT